MRLIDADKLMEDVLNSMPTGSARGVFRAFIEEQPTAFDVDKVVEQLEEEKMWYETHGVNMDMKKGIIGATCKAINIVKAGGIDERNT